MTLVTSDGQKLSTSLAALEQEKRGTGWRIGTTDMSVPAGTIIGQLDLAAWQHEMRDTRGRWTRFGGVGDAADTMMKNREGFSVSVRSGREPAHGFMVAQTDHTHVYPENILDDHMALTRAIDDMLVQERSAFVSGDTYLGGWVHDGKLWLEPSDNIASREQAVAEGTGRNQIAIWDVDHGEEIQTGGSGGGQIYEHANSQGGGRADTGGLRGPGRGGSAAVRGGAGSGDSAGIAAQLELTGDGRGHHIPGSPIVYRHGWKRVTDQPADALMARMSSMTPQEHIQYQATGQLPERMSEMRLPEPKTAPGNTWLAEQRRLLTMWTLSFRVRNTTQGTPRDAEFINELHRMYHGPLYPPVSSDCGPGCQDAHRFMAMVERSAETMPMELARGFSIDTDKADEQFGEGRAVDLPLTSWSKSAAVAVSYASRRPPRPGKTKIILRAEPGSRGMDLTPVEKGGGNWLNIQAQQDEVLTGGRYRVTRVVPEGDVTHVYVRQEDFRAE